MKTAKEILSSLLRTAQIGQACIRIALDTNMRPGLRKALESQLREYSSIEQEIYAAASQRGWELRETDPAMLFFSGRAIRRKIRCRNSDSRIADLMIRNNTNSMIRGLQEIHQFAGKDSQVNILSQKVLDCQTACIRQMQGFL